MNENKNYKKQMSAEDVERIRAIIQAMTNQRKELGMSQRDLAVVCGMPQSTIARIETFKTTPNLGTVLRMMHYLGMEIVVDYERSKILESELNVWREVQKGEESGEEKGWIPWEDARDRFKDIIDKV